MDFDSRNQINRSRAAFFLAGVIAFGAAISSRPESKAEIDRSRPTTDLIPDPIKDFGDLSQVTAPRIELDDHGVKLATKEINGVVHKQRRTILPESVGAVDLLLGWKAPDGSTLGITERRFGSSYSPATAFLQRHILSDPSEVDGKFGPKTAKAAREILLQVTGEHTGGEVIVMSDPLRLESPEFSAIIRKVGIKAITTLDDLAAAQILNPTIPVGIEGSESFNPAVKEAQQQLIAHGFSVGETGADGKLGEKTGMALFQFETSRGIPVSASLRLSGYTAIALLDDRLPQLDQYREAIKEADWFKAMPQDWKSAIEQKLGSISTTEADLFYKITTNPVFTEKLNTVQRCKLIDVFNQADIDGKMHLASLMNRTIGKAGAPAVLDPCPGVNREGLTVCVIDKLYDLATKPLQPNLVHERALLLSGVIQQLANPFETNQGPYGRCSGDVIDFYAHLASPGVAAFLSTEPLDEDGSLLSIGGKEFKFVPGSETTTGDGQVTPVESIVQSMLLASKGGLGTYDPVKDCRVDAAGNRIDSGGMLLEDIAGNLNALFGREFTTMSTYGGKNQAEIVKALIHSPIGTVIDLKWRKLSDTEVASLSEKERSALASGGSYSYHVMNYLGVDPQKGVIFVRSWGKSTKEVGRNLADKDKEEISYTLYDKQDGIYEIPIMDRDGFPGVLSRIRGICFDTNPPAYLAGSGN